MLIYLNQEINFIDTRKLIKFIWKNLLNQDLIDRDHHYISQLKKKYKYIVKNLILIRKKKKILILHCCHSQEKLK